MKAAFELLLFSTDPAMVREAVAAGVDGIIVDWERDGKLQRQLNADTQISADTPDDLRRVRGVTHAPIICRINGFCETTRDEVETALEAGATELLLPMVRQVAEVEAVLDFIGGRCPLGILIETIAAARVVEGFARLPLARVYLGLNDLAIERGSPHIFTAITDGTVERLRRAFQVPFGFGGLTLPDRGHPIPCRLLMGEMARLECQFSFLRRSFHRDVRGRALAEEVPRLRAALAEAYRRPPSEVERDRAALQDAVLALGNQWTLAR